MKTVRVHINSPGGSVFDSIAIYNMLKAFPGTVEVYVDGIAASGASMIVMAGDKVIMPANTFLMIHNPITMIEGNAEGLRSAAETLDKLADSMVSIYADKSGLDDDEILAIMDAETWLQAEEALAMGFADEVIVATRIAAKFDLSDYDHAPRAIVGRVRAGGAQKEVNDMTTKETPAETPAEMEARIRKEVEAKIAAEAESKAKADADARAKADAEGKAPDAAQIEKDVRAKIAGEADEIRALCKLAGKPDAAVQFLADGKSPAEVKAALLAEAGDGGSAASQREVNSHRPQTPGTQAVASAEGLDPSKIYSRWNGRKAA
jgi:ATP-dependent protease ClpP protease subunit